jgi:hypothetical protein
VRVQRRAGRAPAGAHMDRPAGRAPGGPRTGTRRRRWRARRPGWEESALRPPGGFCLLVVLLFADAAVPPRGRKAASPRSWYSLRQRESTLSARPYSRHARAGRISPILTRRTTSILNSRLCCRFCILSSPERYYCSKREKLYMTFVILPS